MNILITDIKTATDGSVSQATTTQANSSKTIVEPDSEITAAQPKTDTLEISAAAYAKLSETESQSNAAATQSQTNSQAGASNKQRSANTPSAASVKQTQANTKSVADTAQSETDTDSTSTSYESESTQAKELYQQGKSVEQIARTLSIDVATVESYLGISSTT